MIEKVLQFLNWLLNRWQNRQSLKTFGAARSNQWPKVRKAHLARNPNCAVCGGNKVIEVHHKQPFHLNPELELEPTNLITLCEEGKNGIVCHRAIGHLGSYQSININVDEDSKAWNKKIFTRP